MAQNLLFVSMHIFVWLQISLGSIFLRKCWVPLLFYKTYKKKYYQVHQLKLSTQHFLLLTEPTSQKKKWNKAQI